MFCSCAHVATCQRCDDFCSAKDGKSGRNDYREKSRRRHFFKKQWFLAKYLKLLKNAVILGHPSLSFSAVNALTMRKNSWLSSFVFICTTKPHLFISSPSFKYQNKWNEIPKTKLWFRDELRPPPLYDSQTLQMLCILIRLSDFSFTLQIYLIFSHVPSNIVKHKSPAHFSLPPTH